MMIAVFPARSSSTWAQTRSSVSRSSALVGSSRITIGADAQERAGEGEALPLAAREGRAVLADHGVVALGQLAG